MRIPGLFIWELPQGEVAWPRCSLKTWYKMVLSCCLFLAWVRHLSLLVALSNQEMVAVKGSNTISNIASLISSQWNYHNFTHVQLQLFPRLEILEKKQNKTKQNKNTKQFIYIVITQVNFYWLSFCLLLFRLLVSSMYLRQTDHMKSFKICEYMLLCTCIEYRDFKNRITYLEGQSDLMVQWNPALWPTC